MDSRVVLILLVVTSSFSCNQAGEAHHCIFTDDYSPSDYIVEEGMPVTLSKDWKFSEFSKITAGQSFLHKATEDRKNITVAINAGHGTAGGSRYKTFSHPDGTPKLTGGTTAAGAIESIAVSGGMTFCYGMSEAEMNLRLAAAIRKKLLKNGFDVLMIRNSSDVQLDNVARTVIANNTADIHIALHFDSDGFSYDKGVFYCGMPPQLQHVPHITDNYRESERLGVAIITAFERGGHPLFNNGRMELDLTTTSYATIPTVVMELGNQHTVLTVKRLESLAESIYLGVQIFYNVK